ncbi:30S ribosomal protein S8 [Poriferisphaera sp. WC338]|uniref:30S ribosomal protein S8 n=1 Tax=Poriferisphaera sp. WC338 TaxID=3425129 RepID=UPI003D817273
MSLSDPIADMLTRIRNAVRSNKTKVDIRGSKVCTGIAKVLKEEGFVDDYNFIDDGRQGIVRIDLRYGPNGEKLIHAIKRESTPGRRVYRKVSELPRPLAGLGICVVSTPKGVLSDRQARKEQVGGELLCTVE